MFIDAVVWLRRLNWPTLLLHLGVCLQGRNTLQVHNTELPGFSVKFSEPSCQRLFFWRNVLYVSIDGKPDLANVIQGRRSEFSPIHLLMSMK